MQLPNYSTARVLVVGDLMLDRYWHGATSRISPEAPVPVVHVNQDEQRPGGAGNVALNIAALGAKVSLMGFAGADEAAQSLQQILKQAGVLCLFEQVADYPTITKLRVMSRHQQLIRLDFEDGFHRVDSDRLLHQCHAELTMAQVVVLSDYGKGTLNKVEQFIKLARMMKKLVLIDPKGSDFSIYRDATLITPNLSEFEAVVGRCDDEAQLVERGMNLLAELNLEGLLITRGEQGMTLLQREQEPLHLPTHAREVFDVTGAGDTVISVLAASLAAKQSLPDATMLANIGAGIVVGKMGTATVNTEELQYALQGQRAHHRGVVSVAELQEAMQEAHDEGEKIVLTNGCFDILHPGHVRYLQQARALGDRLVVLVNSDDSVRRLKGPERPVNKLEQRMEMLAALECVDWVVSFDSDTPKELIDQLLPDILVKGGDYSDITQIAGHESVLANGGEVKILSFIEGHSTTSIIKTIRGERNG
ncbi:bifunctional D-glycero-beta-D-manno-heptose-7-phosphate kinase/D-glycero-beta-D-manno-heptose 1-phosphate adenylyltransferase HldE [Methylomarinum vadi]|uniref:bifunctional D-glycero-beta-D-manno-heptose-7-phosphate kinase/D-glycero-beta-D-manno-heptose 1-phosphate adenylyltransferase HldE n=1 Tax=Methylomarinum vadi TaxID=438855 RepID=UPI0004DF7AFE|nr:bifunctional D-glycero-beta-D-manno-heptose-7-phosphate kinase/D-glycero-beta-D-manno-heptose 1-phosphate adenylyltransferase HldE [Methylomarinum vadi]